ncbi:hypothetical protein MUCCIDRAFT_168323 [Mucor lusitanicus CBS 277.49]|uniref:Uncharacterized protein n=1 Tax=Mucor lusitanicus CBS 277.49 TaxID=747725 RepID=A0A168GFK1_MUCCL|nr:hypothetical protein MUCCIDRAFT_168323 [Mucor lusitanicus CBS 277.49]
MLTMRTLFNNNIIVLYIGKTSTLFQLARKLSCLPGNASSKLPDVLPKRQAINHKAFPSDFGLRRSDKSFAEALVQEQPFLFEALDCTFDDDMMDTAGDDCCDDSNYTAQVKEPVITIKKKQHKRQSESEPESDAPVEEDDYVAAEHQQRN